jgi:hypothetical protein
VRKSSSSWRATFPEPYHSPKKKTREELQQEIDASLAMDGPPPMVYRRKPPPGLEREANVTSLVDRSARAAAPVAGVAAAGGLGLGRSTSALAPAGKKLQREGDAEVSFLGGAKSLLGDTNSSLGDAKSSLGDAESSLGDATNSLGDATSSLGEAESSLGDAKRAHWVTLTARWVTLRARWVTLRARWVTLRARWVTLRAR